MNAQTTSLATSDVVQTADLVEICVDLIEFVGGGDNTAYPIGPR
jgi:hypothetical protein